MQRVRNILNTTCFPVSREDFEGANEVNTKLNQHHERETYVDCKGRTKTVEIEPEICICTEEPPCLHFLAKTGQLEKLKIAFLSISNSQLLLVDNRKRTILHYAANFRGDAKKSKHSVKLIIAEFHLRNMDITSFLNAKDELGATALYLGVKTENSDVCETLIRAGSDWDIMCKRRKSPIQKMFKKMPHLIASYFLQSSIDSEFGSVSYSNPEASEINIDFGFLIGYPSDEDIKHKNLSIYEESDFLSNLCYTPVHKRGEILKHPLVKTFIFMKWQKIKIFFWMARMFQVIWALIYFWFLMEVYRKLCPFPTNHKFEFTWFNFIPSDQVAHQDIDEGIFDGEDDQSSPIIMSCRSEKWIEITAYALIILATLDLLYFEVHPTYIRFKRYWYPMKTINPRKLYKRLILLFRLLHLEKSFLLITIYMNVLPLLTVPIVDPLGEWQYIFASAGVFLTWVHIFLQIGKIPKFAVYIKMLEKVLTTLAVISLIYISLIFAFGMVFSVLLPGIPSYSSPFQAIVKMSTFIIGELEYEKFFYEENSKHVAVSLSLSMFFYAVAILVLHVALLNFLIALTVADVQDVEKYSEVWRSFSHVWQISLSESFLSRVPFGFGLPWLKMISITKATIPKKASMVSKDSLRSDGQPHPNPVDMLVKVRLKDLPKPLSKEIRGIIKDQRKNFEKYRMAKETFI